MRWIRPNRCSILFGIPGQVVVDHQVAALEVHAFAGGIVGDQHQQVFVLHEALDHLAALLARYATMDHVHGFGVAEARAHLVEQVVERVLGLGEDDQLATIAGGVDHQIVVEDAVELRPFRVHAGAQDAQAPSTQGPSASRPPARAARPSRPSSRRLRSDPQARRSPPARIPRCCRSTSVLTAGSPNPGPPSLCGKPRFRQLILQPLAAALQRLVDRGR